MNDERFQNVLLKVGLSNFPAKNMVFTNNKIFVKRIEF